MFLFWTVIISLSLFIKSNLHVQEVVADGPIEIWSIEGLDDMRNNLSGHYVLMRDLDFCDEDSYDTPYEGVYR